MLSLFFSAIADVVASVLGALPIPGLGGAVAMVIYDFVGVLQSLGL